MRRRVHPQEARHDAPECLHLRSEGARPGLSQRHRASHHSARKCVQFAWGARRRHMTWTKSRWRAAPSRVEPVGSRDACFRVGGAAHLERHPSRSLVLRRAQTLKKNYVFSCLGPPQDENTGYGSAKRRDRRGFRLSDAVWHGKGPTRVPGAWRWLKQTDIPLASAPVASEKRRRCVRSVQSRVSVCFSRTGYKAGSPGRAPAWR